MSMRYKGGVISATPPTVSTTSAPGIWTLQQQFQNAGNWPFGGPFTYIEDVFSTYLYTGNGSSQTITNNIDLAGKGGLVWIKRRNDTNWHQLQDTARGAGYSLNSNSTAGQGSQLDDITSFGSTGFNLTSATGNFNVSGGTYVSWTFREQPKFFDVVTWTGNGTAGRQIAHNLGSSPGCIMVKCTNTTFDWIVWHRSLGANNRSLFLNTTDAYISTVWSSTAPTSTNFTLTGSPYTNQNGSTYVAYIFAHDAGGFGLTGSDNVITCGSYTGNGTSLGPLVNLGYEPQWLLVKDATNAGNNWILVDTMRRFTVNTTGDGVLELLPNSSNPDSPAQRFAVNSTGFQACLADSSVNGNGSTYIYIAIRRGPMKTPTTGANVFQPYNAPDNSVQSVGFPTDMYLDNRKAGGSYNTLTGSRLIGTTLTLSTASAAAQTTSFGPSGGFDSNTAFAPSMIGEGTVWYSFRRAPGFFDVVCYTGTGGLGTVTHNLGAVPELMIVKSRSNALDWIVYSQPTGNNRILKLNSSGTGFSTDYWQDTTPTATSVFLSGVPDNEVYGNGITYVMYLFASCPGVSKVGSYTGTGTTLQVNCGFTGGARFVLIKRTDDSGDWYVWDSARGIVSGNDPYLLLNSTAAEVTNTDYVDTYSAGFEISSTAPAAINANGGTFIFLAIA